MALVVLLYVVPGSAPPTVTVTSTCTVHDAPAARLPLKLKESNVAFAAGLHVTVAGHVELAFGGVATFMFAGRLSVKLTLLIALDAFGFVIVNFRVEVPFVRMSFELKILAR